MKILKTIAVQAVGAGFYMDLQAVKQGAAIPDGFLYRGLPVTPGFKSVRQVARAVSILLFLENGTVAQGDCVGVTYSSRMGRDKLVDPDELIPIFNKNLAPLLVGRELGTFRELAEEFENITFESGIRLHTALRYGLSQAFLNGVALSRGLTMAEVIAEEWGLEPPSMYIPLNLQAGHDWYIGVDKIILLRGPIIHTGSLLNMDMFKMQVGYLSWLRQRIIEFSDPHYRPTIHFDCYGHLGLAFNHDLEKILTYMAQLERLAEPFNLMIEDPVNMGEKSRQIEMMSELRHRLRTSGLHTVLVADELCPKFEDHKDFASSGAADYHQIKVPDLGGIHNAIETVLHLKKTGVGTYLGGSLAQTIPSARVSVHIGMATRPDQMLACAGLGVNESYSMAFNEMELVLALVRSKISSKSN